MFLTFFSPLVFYLTGHKKRTPKVPAPAGYQTIVQIQKIALTILLGECAAAILANSIFLLLKLASDFLLQCVLTATPLRLGVFHTSGKALLAVVGDQPIKAPLFGLTRNKLFDEGNVDADTVRNSRWLYLVGMKFGNNVNLPLPVVGTQARVTIGR
jgi:hypothetical protein